MADGKNLRQQIATLKNTSQSKFLSQLRTPGIVKSDLYYISPLFYSYSRSVGGEAPQEQDRLYMEHFSQNVLGYQHTCPLHPKISSANKKKPIHSNTEAHQLARSTLVFDLDETLIHCKDKNPTESSIDPATVLVRPHLFETLKRLKVHYELGLFTSSQQDYADMMVSFFDPAGELFDFRLYGDSCVNLGEGILTKDLRVLNPRPTDRVLIVDNNLYCYGLNLSQGVPVLPFTGDQEDQELPRLAGYLEFLAALDSPGEFNQYYFGYDLLRQYSQNAQLLPQLILTRIVEVSNKMGVCLGTPRK